MNNPFAPIFEKLESIEKSLNGLHSVLELKNSSSYDEFMNVQQVANFIEESVASIYTRTSSRTIPFYKKGKRLLFKKVEILRWIESGKKKTIEEIQNEI
jgi:predicted DNA-binding transcriptional regulator AlpA